MSKIVYLLGAGASFGKRAPKPTTKDDYEEGAIIEGLPIVKELPERMEYVVKLLSTYQFDTQTVGYGKFVTEFKQGVDNYLETIINDLWELMEHCRGHASIDTYAKKLWLTNDTNTFNKVKGLIGLYFTIEQIINEPDKRYDTFLASVLQKESRNLPEEMCVLSWNYDSQITIACKNYGESYDLTICDRMMAHQFVDDARCKIIQLNGSATLSKLSNLLYSIDYSLPADKRLTNDILLSLLTAYAKGDYNFKSHIAFAWEDDNQNEINNLLQSKITDAQVLVVIGYSFPFFNREVDQKVFSMMPNLSKIYIQSKDPEEVEQSMRAAFYQFQTANQHLNNNIVKLANVEQFYLPAEL